MKEVIIAISLFFVSHIYAQGVMMSSDGVLRADIRTHKEKIELYNIDGSIWMRFDFYFEEILKDKPSYTYQDVRDLYLWPDSFDPYFLKLDYSLLMFKCVGEDSNGYKVVVNEDSGEIKYIRKDSIWHKETWEEHILNAVVSVGYENKTNPIRIRPSIDSEKITITGEVEFYYPPIDIIENWLKIGFTENNIDKEGWIKWRNGNRIIIPLDYLL